MSTREAGGDYTVLCTGDLHLGRHPTRIPEELDRRPFSPKTVWQSTVDMALERDVDAVLISGDIIDNENHFFEAYGAFEMGARRLDEADIPTVVVSGNHDFDVLPHTVADIGLDRLTLIGTDGTWERHTLYKGDDPFLHVDGWSFPSEHVLTSPFEEYDLTPEDAPVIGLVHGDLDAPDSDYGPIRRSELEASSADSWVLGHIHAPGIRLDAEPLTLYPGSPQALDPGEPGAHGPWLLHCDSDGHMVAEHISLSSIRYDQLTVDVSGIEDTKDVASLVGDRIDNHVRTTVDTQSLELLLARITLDGQTPVHGELEHQRETIEEGLEFVVGSLPVRVDSLIVGTEPDVDLEDLAKDDTPVAYLAGLLLSLENGDAKEDHPELISEASDALQEVRTASTYAPLRKEGRLAGQNEEQTIEVLQQQGRLLLHELLDQQGGQA